MLKNYLKIAFRNLWKNRMFTAINLLGLSLGLASAGVLILFTQRGITFDGFHKDNDQLHFVQTEFQGERYNQTVYPILEQLVQTFPEIETGTHVQAWNNVWINYRGKDFQGDTKYVDTTFFDVFSFKLKYGNPDKALQKRQSILLNEEVAASLFGDKNPVGETVTVNDTINFTVTGVLEPVPANSSIQFEVLVPIANLEADPGFAKGADWYNTIATVYLKLKKGTDVQALETKFPGFAKTHFSEDVQRDRKIRIAPFTEFIHYENPGFKWLITGAVTIAVFIILIISINLINLNTAISYTRAKEVAVRKVTGSTLRQILIQFWVESGMVLLCSLVIAVLFGVLYLVPRFNEFRKERMQLVVSWEQDYVSLLTLVGVITLIAIVAGTYPAAYLNKLDIRDTIKGKLTNKPQSGNWKRGALIVVQFVISFGLVIGAVTVSKQISFMREADIGYEKTGVVVVQTDMQFKNQEAARSQFKPILDELNRDSRVKSVSTSGVVPTKYWSNYNSYLPEESETEVRFKQVNTGAGYAEAFAIPMLEGRDFSDELDKGQAFKRVVINESAMKALGWKTAVGKRIRQKSNSETYTVVGVMKDFHYQDLKEKIEPLLHWYEGEAGLNRYLTIRFNDISKAKVVLADLEAKMKKIPARKPFRFFYMSDEVNRQYNHLDGIWKMLNFVTTLAVIIAMAGIFGLITLAGNQRTKEVGIRKTLGASVTGIAILLSRDFVLLVLISIVIGIPVGYSFMVNYLAGFQYHVQVDWSVFVIVALAALILTILTVSIQSIRTALMNPVKSLRSE
jgi:putative ABC transport system permease protein